MCVLLRPGASTWVSDATVIRMVGEHFYPGTRMWENDVTDIWKVCDHLNLGSYMSECWHCYLDGMWTFKLGSCTWVCDGTVFGCYVIVYTWSSCMSEWWHCYFNGMWSFRLGSCTWVSNDTVFGWYVIIYTWGSYMSEWWHCCMDCVVIPLFVNGVCERLPHEALTRVSDGTDIWMWYSERVIVYNCITSKYKEWRKDHLCAYCRKLIIENTESFDRKI